MIVLCFLGFLERPAHYFAARSQHSPCTDNVWSEPRKHLYFPTATRSTTLITLDTALPHYLTFDNHSASEPSVVVTGSHQCNEPRRGRLVSSFRSRPSIYYRRFYQHSDGRALCTERERESLEAVMVFPPTPRIMIGKPVSMPTSTVIINKRKFCSHPLPVVEPGAHSDFSSRPPFIACTQSQKTYHNS